MARAIITTLLLALEFPGASSLKMSLSADKQAMSPYVCFMKHPDYNATKCEDGALGLTLDSLRKKILGNTSRSRKQYGSEKRRCNKRVKVFTIIEMETKFPELAECWLSTYAGLLQDAVQNADCQAESIDDADAIYMPAYLAEECNWPHYGGVKCHHQANTFRDGRICRDEALKGANLLMEEYGKPVIINDMHPFGEINGLEAKHIWAKLELYTYRNIEHHTISLPPPPTFPRCQLCSTNKTTACYGTALNQKKYNMAFKGDISYKKIRQQALQYHNPGKGVIVVDSGDEIYDFDELLFDSMFSLILSGDNEFSYRFTEAVCSGGVPVLVTDRWVPPFEGSVPFKSYGIKVSEADLREGRLMAELEKYTLTDLEEMRRQGRKLCENSLNDVALQGRQMISEILSIL